jgi:hypothetical protein
MNVFISYAREDSASAERLYHDLSSIHGVTPWLDSKKLLPGVHWKNEIMDALKTCDLFIVLLSTKSVSKNGFIQKEVIEALDKLKTFPPDRIFVVPARLNECYPKHPELHELQWVDLFPDWSNGFTLISKVINKLKGKPVDSPSAPDDIVMETITSEETFHRRFQARGEMRGCDIMAIGLSALSLAGVDLAGANFVRCHLKSCDFQNANLKGVNFEGTRFVDCKFAGANLWGVNFWGADISGIKDISKSVLSQTNFFYTKMTTVQENFLRDNSALIHLADYGAFLRYFQEEVGMDGKQVASTFIWFNHRYFRMMFHKNKMPG